MLQLDLGKDDGQLEDKLLLLVLLSKHGRHLLLQVADDVCVDLREDSVITWGPEPRAPNPELLIRVARRGPENVHSDPSR